MADHDPLGPDMGRETQGEPAGTRPASETPERWHFCHLPFAYQLLIWAARMWNNENVEPARRWATIRQAFAKVSAEDATVPFLRLMEVIQAGATQTILIGEGGCGVFADEIRLAEVVASAARGNEAGAAFRLRGMLAPSAARVARTLAMDLAAELDRAGLRFTRTGRLQDPAAISPAAFVH